MNFKKILLLVAVLIVLIVAIQIVNKSEKQKEETEGKLINLDQEGVVRLELANNKGSFVFRKQNQVWTIESPLRTRADSEAIDDILDNFSSLRYEREVEKMAGNLHEYGLDRPEILLKLYNEYSGDPVHVIQIGKKNPLDSSSYTKLSKNMRVVLTAAYKRDQLEKGLYEFRYKRFIEFETLDVLAVDFKYQGKQVVFSRKKGSWFMVHPFFSLAQESTVEEIIHDTSRLEAKTFRGKFGSKQFRKNGFLSPLLELNIKLKNGEKILKVVRIEDSYLAHTPDFEDVCQIEKEYIQHFNKELAGFREYKVARFYSFDVLEIKYSHKSLHFVMRKDTKGNWKWTRPVMTETIDENRVNDLLSALHNLEADSFVDKPSGQESFLHFFELKLKTEGSAEKLRTIKISFSNKRENSILVRNSDLPYLFLVSPDIADILPEKIGWFYQDNNTGQSSE